MLRPRENTVSIQAGLLAIGVHAVLLVAMLLSVNWKATHPVSIAEVELWDSIPNVAEPKVLPPPVPEPLVEEAVKPPPPPEPVVEEAPKVDPQVEIALENKRKAQEKADEKLKEDKLKKEKELEKKKKLAEMQAALLKDDLHANDKALKDKKLSQQNDAAKKLAQEFLAEDKATGDQQGNAAKAAASAGVIGEYQSKIRAKIRSNVNQTLCGTGNPELKFEIGLLPTGQLNGSPKLTKSSGNTACDEAVERAIMLSEPLPLPPKEMSLFSQFRDLKLTFRPNDSH